MADDEYWMKHHDGYSYDEIGKMPYYAFKYFREKLSERLKEQKKQQDKSNKDSRRANKLPNQPSFKMPKMPRF